VLRLIISPDYLSTQHSTLAMRDSTRNRSRRSPRPAPYRSFTLVVAVGVLVVLLLIADQAGMLGSVRGQAATLLSPILQSLSRIRDSVSGVGEGLSNIQQLNERVQALEAENSQLKAQIIASLALEQENARLREELGIEQQRGWKLLGADVSARTPDEGRRVVLMAVGSAQGVRPGMAVIAKEGSSPEALIGIVEQVGPQSASVLLITDFASAVSALVYHGNQSAEGIIQGRWQSGSRIWLEQVERGMTLAPGDVVVTAGLTARLSTDLPRAAVPNNIPIGTVERAQSDGHSQMAELRPFVDPDRIRYVWVILSQDE
jgi:rod shape-determining protein MreC